VDVIRFCHYLTVRDATRQEIDGLGLSLSRSIILEHNGKMSVESKYGHGATFIVEIPIIEVLPSEVEAATP
jgi:signal transduction histidine kinase